MCTKFTLMIYSIIMTQIRFALKILCSTVLLSFVNTAAGAGILERMGWSEADVDREVATYVARVEAEVLSQTQPDDASADALRVAAPEARAEILEPVPLT